MLKLHFNRRSPLIYLFLDVHKRTEQAHYITIFQHQEDIPAQYMIYGITTLVQEQNKKSAISVLLITTAVTSVPSEIHFEASIFTTCDR